MKNSLMIVVILLALVVGGFAVYVMTSGDVSLSKDEVMVTEVNKVEMVEVDKTAMQNEKAENDVTALADSDETMIQNQGAYVPFSPVALSDFKNSKRVLFFYANWCPTCKAADASLTQNLTEIPADATVIRINYNDTETDKEEKDLAEQYGITYQHTFIQIDAYGNEVTKWNGGAINELVSNLQ